MKRKVLAVVLIFVIVLQITAMAESSYEEAKKEFSWIYEQVPEEVDESKLGYNPDKVWKEFYVSNSGTENGDGSPEAPFATLEQARDAVRKVNGDMQGDIIVHIEKGFYYMDKKLVLEKDDSGTNGYNVVWLGDKADMPVISGGKKLDKMQPSQEYQGLYEVKVDYPDRILNLYVNGHSREVASGNNLIHGQKRPSYMETNEWYEQYPNDRRHSYEYFDTNTEKEVDGVYVKKEDIAIYDNLEDVFAVYNPSYRTYVLDIEEITENPDNSDQYIVRYSGGWEFMSQSTSFLWPSGDKAFRVKNAFELLDSPGEFYFNRKTKTLYYMPYEDEDMETAEVIMPYNENLISIKGDDRKNKAKNIVFEGLEFAHTAWNRWSKTGFRSNYGTTDLNFGADGLQSGMPAYGISVGFSENITFKNNYFFGIGGTALWIPQETNYMYLIGNAFADIGNTGFLVDGYSGSVLDFNNDDYYAGGTPEGEQKDKPLELLGTSYATLEVSYDDAIKGDDGKFMMGKHILVNKNQWENYNTRGVRKTWVDEYDYPNNAWRSNPKAVEKGEKSWIKYDFGDEYTVSKIALAFADGVVSESEKSNYEILLSNDMYFSEGSYKTVAVQNEPAEVLNEYEVKENGKFRYMLIRTIDATPLAVSGVWAFSYDKKPYAAESRSKYIYVQNNKFSRMGINVENSSAITMNFVENKVVSHNEVDTTGYGGIQLLGGQGANERQSHKYGLIADNYVSNTNKMMPDGSGFYVHGFGGYNVFEGNYAENNGVGVFGYYTDGGASAWLFNNNIAEDMPTSYAFYYVNPQGKSSTMGNISRNMYSPHSVNLSVTVPEPGYDDYYWPLVQNDAEEPKIYLRAQPTKEVYAIKKNAGLEKEFEWIRDIIPDDTDHNLDPYLYYAEAVHESEPAMERRTTSQKQEAQNIIANGVFGTGLGEIDVLYKEKLEKAVNDVEGTENTDAVEKNIALKKLLKDVAESVERYSLEETLQICIKLAENTDVDDSKKPKLGTVSSENKDRLKEVLDTVSERMKLDYTALDEFDMLISLESAYNDFSKAIRTADIESVVVSKANSVKIDKEKCEAVVYMPSNIDLTTVSDVQIITSESSEVGRILYDSMDYVNGVKIPVYCTEADEYKYWTVKICHKEAEETEYISGNSFQNASFENIRLKASKSGTVIEASPYANMSSEYNGVKNGASVIFKPYAVNEKKEFTFIVGASKTENYSLNSSDSQYDRVEVKFTDFAANIYSVIKGKKTLIKSVKADINYNEKNEFSYSFQKVNNTECLQLKLNGKTIANEALINKTDDYYFGIYSPVMNIEIFDKK